ncbi:MAG: alpha-glucan phosphorylase [Candidatus Peribacteria bacterium]|nr:alpha-glucan phosphorylase [Candidatus Peribacteria bacterium]
MTQPLTVAYFTMEIGFKSSIPTYAGGLGILAADIMRSCRDMDVNAACVTVAWQFGYFHQELHANGTQEYSQTKWNPADELTPLTERVTVEVEGKTVTIGGWKLDMKHGEHTVPVIFLDTNLPENSPEHRDLTKILYGGDGTMRISQEIILGIGGVRMLRALGYNDIGTYHMNEGHCAFLTLELLRERNFKDDDVRQSCSFTTHTPVKAGHDVFGYDLAYKMVGDMLPWHIKDIAGQDALSMTQLAMTMSRDTFGVSRVHGQVSQNILNNPNIKYITNGVHHTEWTSEPVKALFDTYIKGWRENPSLLALHCRDIPDDELWEAHYDNKWELLKKVKDHTDIEFDLETLTIASARRVVPYKRPELIYTNLRRLKEIGCGKLQIIHAGNAHPYDQFSQDVIRRMIERSEELRDCVRIVYIPNYNPDLAKVLVAGADVWLNTPTRLHEASGTSGMKACLNGVLNLSMLDGWWIEGYEKDPQSGWRIGPLAQALDDNDTRDVDAEDLYTQLQYQVIPEYTYPERKRWIHRMKRAIGLMGYFNSNRAVQEYIEKAWTKKG